jgi:hypothetical protein
MAVSSAGRLEWAWPGRCSSWGLIFVLSATRRVVAQNETVPESAHAELDAPDEEEP